MKTDVTPTLKLTGKPTTCCGVLLLAALIAATSACEESAEGREIQLLVEDIEAALEQGSAKQLLAQTTDDFVALPGRLGRRAVTRRMYVMFRLNGGVEALHPRPELEIESADAASLRVPFLIVTPGRSLPELDALYDDPDAWIERAAQLDDVAHAELSLVRRGERWLVQTARFH